MINWSQQRHAELRQHPAQQQHRQTHHVEKIPVNALHQQVVPCTEMTPAKLAEFDVVAFGCPAMGAEQLEESEFEPMFAALEGSLNGKKIALFGSYGWGDGQWMRDWAQRAQDDGAQLFSEEGLICNETPDDDVQAACRKLGADLAAW